MSLCLIPAARLTDQFQTQNPESSLSDKARSSPSDTDSDLILILDTRPLEMLSYVSCVMKNLYSPSLPPPLRFPSILNETATTLFLYAATREDFLSCFEALAKTCWASQSKLELIRITGMFNLNSGYCSQLEEHVAVYLQSRNRLLISKTFVKCRVQKLLHFCWFLLIKYTALLWNFHLCQNNARIAVLNWRLREFWRTISCVMPHWPITKTTSLEHMLQAVNISLIV